MWVRALFFLPVIVSCGVVMRLDNQAYVESHVFHGGSGDGTVMSNMLGGIQLAEYLKDLGIAPELITYLTTALDGIYDIINASGVQILLLLSALQTIPESLFEASSIEGATAWENFWKITMDGKPERLQTVTSLCIRLPHNVRVSGAADLALLALLRGQPTTESAPVPSEDAALQLCSTLFYAPPGCGKTTLLRCVIKTLCSAKTAESPFCAAVLDNGEELCNDGFSDCTMDRFCGYPRGLGMEIATRAFAPQVLICDEIGSDSEAEEVLRAQACGVPLIATAHADSMEMLLRRPCFRRLYDHGVFSRYVRLYRTTSGFSFLCEGTV